MVEEELNSVESNYCQPTEFEKNESDLHIPPSQEADLSNIQIVTSEIPRHRTMYVPNLMLANVISLVPKMDEV